MTDTPADLVRVKLGQRLLHEMALRNWTQSDLAREARKHLPKGTLSRDNVHNYVHGKALPGPGFLLALAKALGTTANDLLPERGVNAPHGSSALPSTDVRDAGEGMAFFESQSSGFVGFRASGARNSQHRNQGAAGGGGLWPPR